MEKINFKFIMELIKTFKDDNYAYFLIEYIKGLELFDVIRDIGKFNIKNSFISSNF